jgi:D-galactarolactone cycloisomerase
MLPGHALRLVLGRVAQEVRAHARLHAAPYLQAMRLAGAHDHELVKAHVGLDEAVEVAGGRGRAHRMHQPLQRREVSLCEEAQRLGKREALDRQADRNEDLLDLTLRDAEDLGTAEGRVRDETLLLELPDRLSNGASADTELRREIRLDQSVPGLHAPADDRCAQRIGGSLTHRLRLEPRQRCAIQVPLHSSIVDNNLSTVYCTDLPVRVHLANGGAVRIERIEVAGLGGATPAGGWASELRADDVVHSLVCVHTDEGVVGVGSTFTSETLAAAAVELLEPLWRGESAIEPERVTEKLHQHTFWLGRGGAVTHAISGIDLALWDIFGKVCAQPVGRLLGGRYRDRVRPYASLLMQDPERLAEELAVLRAQGFGAFKIGWGPFGRGPAAVDEAIVRAARESIGPNALLMVDAGASDAYWPHGYKWALRTARMLDAYDVSWFEEPLAPDAIEDYIHLRRQAPLAIAAGEVLTRRQSFRPWLDRGALDVVQPDVTKVGGLSEQRRIAWDAQEHGIAYVGHGWNTAIGLAADLQLAAALPAAELVEYKTGSPYIDDLTLGGFELDPDGTLAIPDGHGLGVALDPDAVERYTGKRDLLVA